MSRDLTRRAVERLLEAAAPLETGFMESFAAKPPLETAKIPKAPQPEGLDLDTDRIDNILEDD